MSACLAEVSCVQGYKDGESYDCLVEAGILVSLNDECCSYWFC